MHKTIPRFKEKLSEEGILSGANKAGNAVQEKKETWIRVTLGILDKYRIPD